MINKAASSFETVKYVKHLTNPFKFDKHFIKEQEECRVVAFLFS